MNKTVSNFIFIVVIGLIFINCANRGTPQGGDKDITPPKILKSEPENFSTNFKGKEIKIYFDEYIKIKDIQKQLIISPPMKTLPEITPFSSASKSITIKIFDTLQPNTTYAFNFGNSISDNNEGNLFPYYRYVFSTGDYIDSLTVNGQIFDALDKKPDTFVSVGLYEVDSTFNDSIIYKENPKYVTNTLDSATTFSIQNIKAGTYMLYALKDANQDNKFQQKTDKIAFYNHFITVPTDSTYNLRLFSENLDFRSFRPQNIAGQKIVFGYEGDYEHMHIDLLSDTPEDFKHRITKDEKTDSLYYWYAPKIEADSLVFKVTNKDFEKDYTVNLGDKKRDSLTIKATPTGAIRVDEDLKVSGSIPFTAFDASKITIMDKDSTLVDYTTTFDTITNNYIFNFKKTEDNTYKIQVLPEAFTDLFDTKNDTLNFNVKTKKSSEFGYARFTLVNATYPIIFQLVNEKGDVQYEQYSSKQEILDFLNLTPGKYTIRVIFDTNGNKKFDTGNYLKKIQPERVSFFKEIEIRADWGYPETLVFKEEE
ncbi:Ig-like domain-containing protein [Yeosuana marina]|uniref:Ig-like domain-containing protein n=1 Tax=Yeosuana marina TaxID=1565536 RepID=UPI001423452D|nr:Ig-like domain-containing domain [Yeosuana marina]